jgi:hypothetical protein
VNARSRLIAQTQEKVPARNHARAKCASQNAYRHGLAARTPADASWIKKLEILALEIVDTTAGLFDFAQACWVAHAELEVQRVRATITASIAQTFAGGTTKTEELHSWSAKTQRRHCVREEETDQMAEAIRRAVPLLRMLDRYERRATARRENVIRTCMET